MRKYVIMNINIDVFIHLFFCLKLSKGNNVRNFINYFTICFEIKLLTNKYQLFRYNYIYNKIIKLFFDYILYCYDIFNNI